MQRLIAVLACRGVRKSSLSDNVVLEGAAGLSDNDQAALRDAGWRPGMSLRDLLNYDGADRDKHASLMYWSGLHHFQTNATLLIELKTLAYGL